MQHQHIRLNTNLKEEDLSFLDKLKARLCRQGDCNRGLVGGRWAPSRPVTTLLRTPAG